MSNHSVIAIKGGIVKGDEERVYWLSRYLEVLAKGMDVQKEGDTLFERVKELDARGASVNEIAAIVGQTMQIVTDFRKEETTCINELLRLGDVPNFEKLRASSEARSAEIDTFLTQAIMFKEGLKRRGT